MSLYILGSTMFAVSLLLAETAVAQKDGGVASEIENLIKEAKSIKAKAPIIRKEYNEADGEKKNAEKELKLYPTRAALAGSVQTWVRDYRAVTTNPDYRKYEDLKEKYQSFGCEKVPVPRQKVRQCTGQWALINSEKFRRLAEQKKRLEEAGRKLQSFIRRIDKLEKKIAQNNATMAKHKKEYERIGKRLKRIYVLVARFCKMDPKTASPQTLRHCHSIDWDGARKDLPPLLYPPR